MPGALFAIAFVGLAVVAGVLVVIVMAVTRAGRFVKAQWNAAHPPAAGVYARAI